MNRCIGFPHCDSTSDNDDRTICQSCWISISRTEKGRRLRSEYLAAKRKFGGTKLYNDAKSLLEKHLHDTLFFEQKRRATRKQFTIVKGVED